MILKECKGKGLTFQIATKRRIFKCMYILEVTFLIELSTHIEQLGKNNSNREYLNEIKFIT